MEPPSFSTSGPQVVRAAPGSDASLLIPLPSGSPPFHYEWSRAGAKLDSRFKPADDAGGVRLTISSASTGDSGVYTLQASNAAGKDTTRVRLEVSPDEKPTGDDPPTFLRRLQDLTVKVGTRTRFLVEIVSSTECRVTWYRNERRLLEAERIALVRDGNFWCADVSAVSVDDAGRWTCTAENLGGRASCSAHLNVLVPKAYKRPEFVEELRALLTEQGTVSLECKVVGVPTPVLRWFKDSREIKAGDVFALTANAEDPTSLGTYTCEAVNCMGRAYSSSKVHVIGRASREGSARPTSGGVALEPPPIFTKELEDQFVRICEPLTLSCNIVVPPWPRSIVWYNKEGKIEPSERYRVLEDGVGGYLLEVPSAEWPDEGEWKCVATSSGGRVGITTCYVSMDVPKNYRKPRFMENLQAVLTEEGLVSFECKVVGFPTPILSWFKDGQELKPGDVYQLTGTNSLGSYCCIARNCMGQASSSAELTVEDIQNQLNEEEKLQLFSKNQAPKFLQGLKSIEAKIDEPFRFTIKVAIPPEPTVLWYRDDQPVDESSRCHHGKEERGVFFLDIQSLEFMDQAEWKCVAVNDYGHSVTSCFLKLIIPRHYKKPRFLENLQAILSDEGAVNLECKVIGVPQPVLKWYKDGEELKPGDIHRIISGQDGTCCLGTYTCEAQNCMGIAASSASLLGFEDSIKSKTKQKVDEQTLQRNLSLSTIHEERTSQMYDTPVGDITLDDKGEISFSFDGKEVSVSLYETPDLTEEEALQIVEMYADQLSENVTEHNVVELPPLRFVKETSTSGNLLMEAIIIDVSPEYFTSPEEDLRTEADVEDISIADENGLPQLSLDQEVDGEDYLEKTIALLADEKADFPKKTERKKSDSQKSADDYFSLSREQSLSEEKRDDDSQALSGSDLQSFASARSSGKPKSKSSKPSIEDGQESSDVTKTVLLKEDLQTLRQNDEIDSVTKSKRERRSRSSRRSSSGSETSLNKIKEEVLEVNLENTLIKTLEQESTKAEINTISSYLTKLINDVQMIERDIILKSELMSTAATASRSLEIINSLITPLSEIHSIADAIKESVTESFQVTKSLFNRLPKSLSTLHQSLTIIEKCIDLESENKTLVKKTCINIIEKCGDELNKLVKNISTIVDKDCPFLEDMSISSIQKTNNDILNTISSSLAAMKECKKFSDKMDTTADIVTPELKHLQKTQKAIYELRNPLQSLLYIAEEVDISSFTSAENTTNSQIILNEMSTPIQVLQNALEQIEFLSVAETQSELQKYNTEIMETVMDSVIKLRTSFEQLSVEAGTMENIGAFEKVLVDIKHNISEISAQLDIFEAKIGSFDVLHSENKLQALQKMAQILINLENSLVILDIVPCLKINMADFHKNLTKILEDVIESNDAKKYITFLEICDVVNRLNALIKNMDSNDIFLLAGISNTLKIIQAIIEKNEFTQQLKLSTITNITDLLLNIHETMNHADTSTYSMISENVEDLSTRHFEEGKLNVVLEQIEKAISTISNVVSLETTKDLDIQQAFNKIIPTLGEMKCCVASLNVNVTQQEENISDMSNFTFIQAIAKPLCELNLGISVLNQTICEKSVDYFENELKVDLATPFLELRNALEILQQDVISQYGEDVDNLNISSSVANAVQSIHSCIIMVREQDLLENADELSTLEDISAIKTSVDILSSDYFVSPTVHEITTAIGPQVIAEIEMPIMQSASARTLRNLSDHILMLQKPEFMEILKELSEHAEYSCIKSITEGLDTIHNAIEVILHPVALEEPQKLSNLYSTKLLSIMQPLQELQEHLSVIDISNISVESAIKMDEKKNLSQFLPTFENCLRDSIDCVHVSIEMIDVAVDISTQIETLRKLCIALKNDIENATIDESSELIMLYDSLTTALDAISCPQEINVTQIKLNLQKLQNTIRVVKDELFGFAVENPTVLHDETRNLKSIEGIEKSIASLAQLQFVDLNQDSDFDYFVSERGDEEIKYEPIFEIKKIVETVENCTQSLPLFMPNNNDLSTKDFVNIFNDEITLLCCLLNQKPTPKRLIKMLQVFYDLSKNLKQFRLHENTYTSKDFSEQMDTLEKSLKKVQVILLEVLNSQSHLVFQTPISNIINNEIILNELLESNESVNLHNFVKLLMNTINAIKPWFENIQADVGKELESCNVNLTIEEDANKNFTLLQSYLSEKIKNNDISDERDIYEAILRVIQKHENCKHLRGSAQKMIFINCISDCLNILKRALLDSNERVLNDECTLDLHNLKNLLTQLSEPIEIFHKKIVQICNENLQNIRQSFIVNELELLESQLKAICYTKIAEKIMKCENLPFGTFTDNSIINLAKEIVIQIHSIQNKLENLESASSDMSMNTQHIKEIERILTTLIPDEDIDGENRQLKQKADSLIQHMEQYIEIIEIVEEVSAIIRLDDLKKSADIVRELRESITSEKLPDINVTSPEFSITGEQIQLVQNLQKALTTLQIEAFECEQELGPHINDDIRQQIIEKVSELQNDLVGLTGTYAVLENSESFESIKQTDKNCIVSIQEEDVAGPKNVIENKEYAIGDAQENRQELLIVPKSDLVVQCDFPERLQTEVSQPKTEISTTPAPDICNEKQSLELMSEIKLSDSKILDLPIRKMDPIKESLIMHINDYLCQNIIEDIKKTLPSKNIEQLEQSLQIAVAVRDNAVLEDSNPFSQQVCLEKQLESVLKLQEVTLATYHEALNDADDETLQSHIGQDSLKTAKSVVHNLLNSIQTYITSLNNIIWSEAVVVPIETCTENLQNVTKTDINICDKNNSVNEDQPVDVLNEGQKILQENNNYEIFGDGNNYAGINIIPEDMCETKVMENQEVNEEFKKEKMPIIEVIMEQEKLDEQYLKVTLSESEKSLDSEILNASANIENITEADITDSINIQEEIKENSKNQKECNINENELLTEVKNMLMDSNLLSVADAITSVQDDNIISAREDSTTNEEISNAILELETLLHEVNETLNLFENYPEVPKSEEIQDILEEVQTVIMKLKYGFDGTMNDILNENIEDLECNVRSVQLQINENSPPALLKEACANLQSLAAYMKNIHVTQNTKTTNNVLCICTNDAEQAIELLDKVSSSKVDNQFDNIIFNLGVIKDTMKSLKSCFLDDADSLIFRGIEVLQNLDNLEDKVFALEKEADAIENMDINFRDNIIAAIHCIYGSISNMRGTISSIQKKFMYDNYGQPSDNFLKSIKNVSYVLNYDKKEDWKQFTKSLRKILKHFEDVKFYINFDKTARLPSDSAFTKIILHELITVLSGVVYENTKELDKNVRSRIEDTLNYINEILKNMENKPTVEVKEKIPIFKELSIKIFDLTDGIKILISKNIDNIDQLSIDNNVLSKNEENMPKILPDDGNNDENGLLKMIQVESTNVVTSDAKNISEFVEDSFEIIQNKNKSAVHEQLEENCETSDIQMKMVELEEINPYEDKDRETDKNHKENETSSFESLTESAFAIKGVVQENLNEEIVNQDIEFKVKENNKPTINDDLGLIEAKIEDQTQKQTGGLKINAMDINKMYDIGLENIDDQMKIQNQSTVLETEKGAEKTDEEIVSVQTNEYQDVNLSLDQHKTEIKNQFDIISRQTSDTKQEDVMENQKKIEEESDSSNKQQTSNKEIEAAVSIMTKDKGAVNVQIDKHNIINQQIDQNVSKIIEKAQESEIGHDEMENEKQKTVLEIEKGIEKTDEEIISVQTNEYQSVNLSLDQQKTEIENQFDFITLQTSDNKQEDVIENQDKIEKESDSSKKKQTTNKEIESAVSITTKDKDAVNIQIDKHDNLNQQNDQEVSKIIEKAQESENGHDKMETEKQKTVLETEKGVEKTDEEIISVQTNEFQGVNLSLDQHKTEIENQFDIITQQTSNTKLEDVMENQKKIEEENKSLNKQQTSNNEIEAAVSIITTKDKDVVNIQIDKHDNLNQQNDQEVRKIIEKVQESEIGHDKIEKEKQKTVLETEKGVENTDEEIISVQTNEFQGVNLSLDQHKTEIENQFDIITRQTSDTKQEDVMENQKKIEEENESLNKQQTSNNEIEAAVSIITTKDKDAVNIQIDKHDNLNQQNDIEVNKIIEKVQESEIGHDKMEKENQKTVLETEKGVEKTDEEIISVQTNEYQGVNLSLDQQKTEIENQFDFITLQTSDTKQEDVIENQDKIEKESDSSKKKQTTNKEIEAAVSITTKDKDAVNTQIDKHDNLNQPNDQEVSKIIKKTQESENGHDKMETEKQKTVLETDKGVEKTDEEIISVHTNEFQGVNLSLDQHKTEIENQFDIITRQISNTKQEDVTEDQKKIEEESDSSNKQQTLNKEIETAVLTMTKDKGALNIQIDKHDIINQQSDQEVSQIIEKAQESEIGHDKMENEKQKTVLETEKGIEKTDEEIISVHANEYQGVNLSLDQHKTEIENQFDIIAGQISNTKQEDVTEDQKKIEEESDSSNKQQISNKEIDTAVSTMTKDKGALNIQIDKHDIINQQSDQEMSQIIEKVQESEIGPDKMKTENQNIVLETEKVVESTNEEMISVQTNEYQGVTLSLDQHKTEIKNQIDIITRQTSDTKQENVMENQKKIEEESDNSNKQQTSNNEIEAAISITTKDEGNIQGDKHDTFNQQNDIEMSQIIKKAQESEIGHLEDDITSFNSNSMVSELVNIQEAKEDKFYGTMFQSLVIEDFHNDHDDLGKQQKYDEIIPLATNTQMKYTELKDSNVEEKTESIMLLNENSVVNTNAVQKDEKEKKDKDSTIELVKLENKDDSAQKILLSEQMLDIENVKVVDMKETQKIEISRLTDPRNKAEIKDDLKKEIDVIPPKSTDLEKIYQKEEESLSNVEIKNLSINDKKLYGDEEIKKENVLELDREVNSVKDRPKLQEDISIIKYDKTTTSTSSEESIKNVKKEVCDVIGKTEHSSLITEQTVKPISVQTTEMVVIADGNIMTEAENKIISEKPAQAGNDSMEHLSKESNQQCINEIQRDFKGDAVTEIDKIVKDESQDVFDTNMKTENGDLHKKADSKASYQNADIEKEKKEFLAPAQNIQKEQDEQQVTLGKTENESNLDNKFEKNDEKSKMKIKKTTKSKTKETKYLKDQEEAKSISQEDQQKIIIDEELVKKKKEIEINKYREEIKIEEKNGNNVKPTPMKSLGEQLLVQGDKSDEQKDSHQKIHRKVLQQEQATDLKDVKEEAIIILQDDQQQTKLEIDEALKIVHKEVSRTLDGKNIEKKGIDSTENNQSVNKTEIVVMSEKQLEEMPIIETNAINIQSEVQKEEKQNGSIELSYKEINDQIIKQNTILESSMGENKVIEKKNNGKKSKKSLKKSVDTDIIPSDSQMQQKIIDTEQKDWDIKETHNNGCELLKSDESFGDKDTSLIEKEGKGLQRTETVLKEFQLDMKQTLSKDYSSQDKSAYSDELQKPNQEKMITYSVDIQESNILSGNEIKLDSKASIYKDIKQRPLFTDRNKPDYEQEFARPPGYTPKILDIDNNSPMEFKATSKSPTIYRAQTLVQESQLRNSLPPQIDQRSNFSEGRSDVKQRLSTASESRSTISEKRCSFPRDFKRKPVFSTHLTDRTAVESSRVKLTCSVLSSTDPVISWYKNGVLLDNKHKCRTKYVDGLITLEILNAIPSDSGEYSCSVENENGSITSSAHLKVYPGFEASPIPPTFTRSIRDIYHLQENELVLECRIRGQPLPIITWLKDNVPIILNERYQAHYLADGVCRLTITSPNQDDSGKYTCKAENSMWSDQISHEVYFSTKESRYIKNIATPESLRINRQATETRRPHFTNVLSDHKVVSGGTIGLQVEISGSPTRVEWLREGQSVTETYRNAQTYIDHGLYTLALSDVTEKESGQYTCRAWSSHGTVDMNASITVVQPNQFEGKPARIISRPVKDLLISVGEDLNISFRVQGEPKPKVFFMKGIRDISNSQRVCKMTSDDYVKFTLKRSVISDAGTYCVFVRNAYGCDRAFVTVVIRQRASSDHLISDWTYPMDDLAISVVDRNYQSVPDRIPSEPTVVDGGNNWVSLAWPKPESQVKAPILAYKVESWLLGKEGGARWLELGITPRNCFDVFNLKQGEEYHFRVTPRNRYGWGESVQTSTSIGIGLAGDRPEFIEILPGQLKVLVGETATLCCSFKGNPIPEIVWMKNGHELEEEMERVRVQLNGNNTSLYISEIKIEDEGRYSCEATNIHGRSSTYSRMAVITDRQIWEADAKLKRERSAGANGEYPPQFTMRLRDRRVQATYPVRLTCQVIGSPSPTVTWFKNGEEVSEDRRHTTSQDEYFYTLEIAPTTLDDGGVYEAMARNGCGAISCRCNLVVDKGIRAYIAPEFCCGFEPLYRVCEGDELRISAVVEAYPSVGVTWYRDGVRLRPSRRAVMTLDRDGQIELALASVAPRDAGIYTCTASNEVGKASTSGKVEVVKGEHTSETPKVPPIVISPDLPYSKEPMFIRKPRSSEAHEGDTVIIECEVIGDPKPDVYWLRDFLKPDYYRDASHFKRVGAGPAYRFEIPHAKFDYTGAYSIVAKNIHGEAKAIISLQILAKDPTCGDETHNIRYGRVEVIPRFDKELTDLLCYDGDAIEFECRVSGNPEPDIRWFHYTETLPECPDFETSYDLGTARLKIKQVTAEDEGTYTCEASNNLGKATSSACLVIYPPGEPNTLSQRLRRPPALLSASSTPRSTPRTTPARSLSRTPGPDLKRLCSPSREIAPKFYTYPYNRVVEEGDTVVFQCAVRGLPPPWATWDKDGIVITPTARISIREKDDMFRIIEIEQVTVEDVGLYRVTLENDYGRAEASARLEVISQTGKFYGSRSYSVSPRKCLPYRRRTPSLTRQD